MLYISTPAGEVILSDDGDVGVSGASSDLVAMLERAGIELEDDPAAFGSRHLMSDGSRALLSKKRKKNKNKGKSKKVAKKKKCRKKWLGDGVCDAGAPYNNNRKKCGYDAGDCCLSTNPLLEDDSLCKDPAAARAPSPPLPPAESAHSRQHIQKGARNENSIFLASIILSIFPRTGPKDSSIITSIS